MLPIQKMLIKYNYSKRNSKIEYIVIHTTGNTSRGAGVDNHFNYFNGADRNASADYFVDDKKIGQFVEPSNYSWHCGDGGGKYGIKNSNSIGIEICVNSDGDYNKAIQNAVDLVKHLMKLHNISINNVVRHYDASRKNCPAEIIAAKNGITWDKFKNMILGNSNSSNSSQNLYRVRLSWDNPSSQKGAFSNLDNAISEAKKNNGYKVYDSMGNQVYPEVHSGEKELQRYSETGTCYVLTTLNFRNKPCSVTGNIEGQYYANESVNYDLVVITEKYVWISWIGRSGARRYMAVKDRITGKRFGNCV